MRKWLERLIREEEGQGLVEYGLILALVAVAVIGALTLLGGKDGETGLGKIFGEVSEKLDGAGN